MLSHRLHAKVPMLFRLISGCWWFSSYSAYVLVIPIFFRLISCCWWFPSLFCWFGRQKRLYLSSPPNYVVCFPSTRIGIRSSKVGKNDLSLQSRIWAVQFVSNRESDKLQCHRPITWEYSYSYTPWKGRARSTRTLWAWHVSWRERKPDEEHGFGSYAASSPFVSWERKPNTGYGFGPYATINQFPRLQCTSVPALYAY